MTSLETVSRFLLESEESVYSMRPEVLQLGEILTSSRYTAPRFDNPADGETITSSGLAVSPRWAEMCLDEFLRTIQFCRGVQAAIQQAKALVSDRPIRLLYAGCGPFATLVIPSLALAAPRNVEVTLIDIHDVSLASVQEIMERQGLHGFIRDYVQADAGEYLIDSEANPDIIVMEILQSCLDKEPQVAVSRHLMAQAPDAILVPYNISVSLFLINYAKEFSFVEQTPSRDRVEVGEVFALNKETIRTWSREESDVLPATTLGVGGYDPEIYVPSFQTLIETAPGIWLHPYDSGLTYPKVHSCLARVMPNSDVQFEYVLGRNPSVRAKIL